MAEPGMKCRQRHPFWHNMSNQARTCASYRGFSFPFHDASAGVTWLAHSEAVRVAEL